MRLLPLNIEFFELLREQARHIRVSSDLLFASACDASGLPMDVALKIAESERACDAILQELTERLRQTFITPLDPEDLQLLCRCLDDVMDGLEEAAHCLHRYRVQPVPEAVSTLCRCLMEATVEIGHAMRGIDDVVLVEQHCREIRAIESRADEIVREAVLELLDGESDAVRIFKLKEIYDVLEATVDACEDVADALRHVLAKNG